MVALDLPHQRSHLVPLQQPFPVAQAGMPGMPGTTNFYTNITPGMVTLSEAYLQPLIANNEVQLRVEAEGVVIRMADRPFQAGVNVARPPAGDI